MTTVNFEFVLISTKPCEQKKLSLRAPNSPPENMSSYCSGGLTAFPLQSWSSALRGLPSLQPAHRCARGCPAARCTMLALSLWPRSRPPNRPVTAARGLWLCARGELPAEGVLWRICLVCLFYFCWSRRGINLKLRPFHYQWEVTLREQVFVN